MLIGAVPSEAGVDGCGASPHGSLLGHTIGTAHRLVGLLDAEGLTDAYRAWDGAADRDVAIKALAKYLPDTLLRRFEFAISACGHEPLPHVVPVLKQGVH